MYLLLILVSMKLLLTADIGIDEVARCLLLILVLLMVMQLQCVAVEYERSFRVTELLIPCTIIIVIIVIPVLPWIF